MKRVPWWAPILLASGLTAAGGAFAWGARAKGDVDQAKVQSVVAAAVDPMKDRVTKLEVKREADAKKIEEVAQGVKETNDKLDALKTLLIERLPPKR